MMQYCVESKVRSVVIMDGTYILSINYVPVALGATSSMITFAFSLHNQRQQQARDRS